MESVFCGDLKKKKFIFNCSCGDSFIGGYKSKHCIHCAIKLGEGIRIKPSMTAGDKESFIKSLHKLSCNDCESKFQSELSEDNIFCPICASSDVENEVKTTNDYEDNENGEGELKDDNDETSEDSEENQGTGESKDYEKELVESLQGSILNGNTWIFFNKDEPFFKISKDNVSNKTFFESNSFFDLVVSSIREKGLNSTIKEFNAELYNFEDKMDSLDLEEYAFNKFHADFIPKFLESIDLALKGTISGIFSDQKSIMQQFSNEFVALNIPKKEADKIVLAAFKAYGHDAFSSLILKAAELMKKPNEVKDEIKNIIASASLTSSFDESALDRNHMRSKLNEGNMFVSSTREKVTGLNNKVNSVRKTLNFRGK